MARSGWKALALGVLLGLAGQAKPADEVRLYRPRGRPAVELAPIVDGVLQPEGAAVADPGSGALVLRGSPEAIEQALALLQQLDAPLRSYRVQSEVVSREQARARGFGVAGWLQVGALRVGRLREGPPAGEVAVRLDTRDADSAGRRRSELVVLEGREGRIATGHLIPVQIYQERHHPSGPTDLLVSPALMPVESGIRVRVRRSGEELLGVELEPFDAAIGRASSFAMATRLQMRPGETLAVGGLLTSRGAMQGGSLSYEASDVAEDSVVLLRVSPLER
jgi:hypothetical protein